MRLRSKVMINAKEGSSMPKRKLATEVELQS